MLEAIKLAMLFGSVVFDCWAKSDDLPKREDEVVLFKSVLSTLSVGIVGLDKARLVGRLVATCFEPTNLLGLLIVSGLFKSRFSVSKTSGFGIVVVGTGLFLPENFPIAELKALSSRSLLLTELSKVSEFHKTSILLKITSALLSFPLPLPMRAD